MKKFLLWLCAMAAATSLGAQEFDTHLTDRTLRADYILSGDRHQQDISLRQLHSFGGWNGRRTNLDHNLVEGNGRLRMVDNDTGATLYTTSFSTLFQEWLTMPEAEQVKRSFEFTILVPMPQQKATITVELSDARGKVTATLTHPIDPADILIHNLDGQTPAPHRYIVKNGSAKEKIDVAIVAEGYTAQEMNIFLQDAQATVDALASHEPFGSMMDKFNFVAVESPSDHSGVSIPGQGIWHRTAVDSHFDTFYSDRYLTTSALFKMHDLLVGIPYEHIIVLANTDTYGGGGIYNSYTLTTAHHPLFKPVVVHEFGHSFGGLADEYFYEGVDFMSDLYVDGIEPWEQNITTLTDFQSKWADMLPEGCEIPTPATDKAKENFTVGVYEGGGYRSKGVYRPAVVCRMRDNVAPQFCPVCQRAIERMIRYYTE